MNEKLERYTEGVWYDPEADNFCRITETDSPLSVRQDGEYLNIHYQDVLTVSISVKHDEILLYTEGVDEPVVKRDLSDPSGHT